MSRWSSPKWCRRSLRTWSSDSLEGRDTREVNELPEIGTLESQIARDDRAVVDEGRSQKDEIDWERYLENHCSRRPCPCLGPEGTTSFPGTRDGSASKGLPEHLLWQLQMGDYADDERARGPGHRKPRTAATCASTESTNP